MKKVLAFVLIATSIISLASCGKKNKLPASYTTIPAPTETTAKEETEEKTTEAATSEEVGETEVATSEETSETETTTSEETGESEEDELPEDENKISEELQEILESYKDENGYMPPEEDILLEAEHKVYEYAQKLEEAGEIEGCAYCDEGYSVSFFLNDGTTTVYAPELQDYYSDGEDFQVYLVDSFMGFQNINAAINFTHPGKTIKKVFPATSYTDYNSSTTIADIKLFMGALSENNVRAVFWRSHGSYYTDKNGTTRSVLGTSEKLSKRNKEYYKEDLEADRLLTFTSGHYAITKHFIETYLYPVRGGLFFTQSCHGTSDGGDLGRAFIEKGFDAYVGGNGSIYIPYGSGIMSATADYLCKKDENGQYYTIREALDLAEKDYKYSFSEMNNDGVLGEGARFYIVGDNDFRLVHTESNRISRSSEAPKEENTSVDEEITTEEIVLESTNISEAEVESEETIDLAEETSDLTQIVQDSFEMWCDDEAWIFVAYWNGHYYAIFPWQQENGVTACDYCESIGGHLATITSQNEQDMIYAFIHAAGDTYNDKTNQYLGRPYFGLLYDENEKVWKWVTNEPLDYTNWDKEVFMYENEKERPLYATMIVADNYMNNAKWVSIRTSDAQAFLCEWDSAELYEKYLQERKK